MLALRQQHEREALESGQMTESQLTCYVPDQIIKNRIRIESGHTIGKTKCLSGLVNHFFDCFVPCVGYCFAPSWEQIHDLLFKEIKTDRRDKGLPGRILDLELKASDNHFIKGKATNNADSTGTERAQGQHGRYNIFVFDEAEGIPDFVWDAVDGMTSGGISIVLMAANPRTRSSRFHKVRAHSNVQSFRVSCLQHPNVIANKEIVPGAVRRQYVNEMIEKHCRGVETHNADNHTFEVPWIEDKVFEPDAEMMFRVLGVAPANISDKNLIPYGRYEAATKREPIEDRPAVARLGIDCARWGRDLGKGYTRWNGRAYPFASFAKQDSFEYYFAAKRECLKLAGQGVTSIHVRVDAGGGFGAGVVDLLKVDDELNKGFIDFKVIECNFGGSPTDKHAYYDSITEWTADVAESLKGLAVVGAPDSLEEDLCEREVEPRNKEGRFVRKLEDKDKFRKRIGRSPDDGDGFILAVVMDNLINPILVTSGRTTGMV